MAPLLVSPLSTSTELPAHHPPTHPPTHPPIETPSFAPVQPAHLFMCARVRVFRQPYVDMQQLQYFHVPSCAHTP